MKNDKGFTLIQLFIIVAIVGIVIAIVAPQWAVQENSNKEKVSEIKEGTQGKIFDSNNRGIVRIVE